MIIITEELHLIRQARGLTWWLGVQHALKGVSQVICSSRLLVLLNAQLLVLRTKIEILNWLVMRVLCASKSDEGKSVGQALCLNHD